MMKTGRNAPCPCGSGKKYKKCCMTKEKEILLKEEVEEVEEELKMTDEDIEEGKPTDDELSQESEPEDPLNQAMNELWKAFEHADYEEKIAIFNKALEEKELMDEQMSFDMLEDIYYEGIEKDDRHTVDELIERLKTELPDIYKENRQYFLDYTITNALVSGKREIIENLIPELSEIAVEGIDTFNIIKDRLAYHGYISPIVKAMKQALTSVRESTDIISFGVYEFESTLINYTMLDYIENNRNVKGDEPEIITLIQSYADDVIEPSRIKKFVSHMTTSSTGKWHVQDFNLTPKKQKNKKHNKKEDLDDEARENLYFFSVEFLGYLNAEEGFSITKADMGRKHLHEYIIKRHKRKLAAQPSMLEQALYGAKPEIQKPPEHPLCPDTETLDVYLSDLFGMLLYQYYKVAACIEVIPAWLRFLQLHNLIDESLHQKTKAAIKNKIVKHADELEKKYTSDPALYQELKKAWELDE